MNCIKLLLLSIGFSIASLDAFVHIESLDGDLSDDYTSPTVLNVTLGDNILDGSLLGSELDLDLFRLVVPAGLEITAINLVAASGGGGGSFLGMQTGDQLSSPPSSSFPGFIGYALLPASGVGTNYLPNISPPPPYNFPPFYGASSLVEGTYAGWLNETGASSTYRLSFVAKAVPEPSSLTLIAVFGLFMLSKRQRCI